MHFLVFIQNMSTESFPLSYFPLSWFWECFVAVWMKKVQLYVSEHTHSSYFSELRQPQASWKLRKRKVILNNATNHPGL